MKSKAQELIGQLTYDILGVDPYLNYVEKTAERERADEILSSSATARWRFSRDRSQEGKYDRSGLDKEDGG